MANKKGTPNNTNLKHKIVTPGDAIGIIQLIKEYYENLEAMNKFL